MPADLNYAYEKYSKARDTLATSTDTARKRLLDAYVGSAMHAHPLRSLPGQKNYDELAARIAAFNDKLTTATPSGGEGSIAATIDTFTDDEVREALSEVVAIADELEFEFHAPE